MRKFHPVDIPTNEEWATVYQIVVPKPYNIEIMRLAHEGSLGGHLGVNKTCDKILKHFYWDTLYKFGCCHKFWILM